MLMRTFDKYDWYSFSGATSTPDGREPLISYNACWLVAEDLKLRVVTIVDDAGLYIQVEDDENDESAYYHVAVGFEKALEIAMALPLELNCEVLQQYGFTC